MREEHRISIREENNPRFTCLSGFFLSTDAEPTSSPILFFYAFSSKRESSWSTSPILQSGSSSSEELSVCDRDLVWKVLKSEHGLWMALCKLKSDETSTLRPRDHRLRYFFFRRVLFFDGVSQLIKTVAAFTFCFVKKKKWSMLWNLVEILYDKIQFPHSNAD